jgi:glutamate N-acetyltransferase / amino-acid N-acetyltransferase
VTATLDPLVAAIPIDLPPVERQFVQPAGFVAGGTTCGIKESGRPDLAVVAVTGAAVPAAAMFTQNKFVAAPVVLSKAHLAAEGDSNAGLASAVIATSGSANAATGADGKADQAAIVEHMAAALGVPSDRVLCMSTGIIGSRLPVELVLAGIDRLVPDGLSAEPGGLEAAAEALRTTDSHAKVATTTVTLLDADGLAARSVRVTGIAKGVGMIHPSMATMLAILTTDGDVDAGTLHGLLRGAVSKTWNQLSIDGDTSTNDTVFLLASGAAAAARVEPRSAAASTLGKAIEAVARDLARQQAADGEGATTLICCQVSGALDDRDARAVAREVVSSSLVKAAVHGRDPNWGRLAGAAGNAPAQLDPNRVRIAIAGHAVYDGTRGGPIPFDREAAREAMTAPEVLLRLDLGLGDGSGEAFGCDLTEEYVRENSEYTT